MSKLGKILLAVLLVLSGVGFATGAPGSAGYWVRTDCTTLTGPVNDQTLCFDSTLRSIRVFSNSGWATMMSNGGISNNVATQIKWGFGDVVLPTTSVIGFVLNHVISVPANGNAWAFVVAGNFVKAGSGTHPVIVNAELDFPHIVGGSATVDTIVGVRIGADNLPPYAEATNVYGLQVINGISLFQGGAGNDVTKPAIRIANNQVLMWLGTAGVSDNFFMNYNGSDNMKIGANNVTRWTFTVGGGLLLADTDPGFANAAGRLTQPNNAAHFWADSANGSANAMFIQGANDNTLRLGTGNATRLTITSGGIFGFFTTLTTSASNGDVIFANSKNLRWVNNAGTDTVAPLTVNTSDQLVLLSSGADIKWNKALVALGGGAAPTFGTIGGSGPATAAQNSWMRVIDSTGAAFWVPAWK